jgi:hypothetical protein
MSAVASEKLGPEVLLVFLGHSSDADALADAIYDLERDLQRLLDQHLSVSSGIPFKTVRVWEWRRDGLPIVGGQDQIVAAAIKRANIAVFVFKERIGSVSWAELNQSRNRENPPIPVLAFFPTDSPADLNDEDRIAKWLDLVKKRSELVKDWSAPNSKALRPMEKYKDAAHLTTLAVEQLSNAVVSLLKCQPATQNVVPSEILPTKFLGDHSHLSYDRQPVLSSSLDELDQDSLKELLAKPLAQDLNADLRKGRDGGDPEVSEQLGNLGCLYAGRPTLGALLCFAPAQLLTDKSGCCTLQMAIHDGSERGGERTSISLARGNLLLLYKRGMSWLTGGAVLRRRGQIGSDARDDFEIPEIVLREALANALVHRDYESKVLQDQPTRIDVYPDKVEITSYGLLLSEVPIDLLNIPNQSLRPYRRNPVIAGIFQCMTLAELNASGVQRMRRVMTAEGLALPLFRTSDNFVCVTLARPFEISSARAVVQPPPGATRETRKAFISSTGELAEHREAAIDACLRAGVIPVMWEEHAPNGDDIASSLKHVMDEADIFVFILGHRYGSIIAPDGISASEWEFNYAVERGLPILVFIMHVDHPVTMDAFENDPAGRERLNQFKERVIRGQLSAEFKSPDDLRSRMLEALAALPRQELRKRFRVAFSFAGEQRDFVAKVAPLLAERFGESAILYDKYHEAEFARSDLAFYLPELYEKETELVVVVVSPGYEKKEWCGLEWNTVKNLLEKPRNVEILLGRFGRAAATSAYQGAGFIELDEKTPEQTAALILERLAVMEGNPRNFYINVPAQQQRPPSTATPNNLPRLQPFFGRERELATIREALDLNSRTWGALIHGPGGMGKTSLAIRAAYDCPPEQFQRIIFLSVNDRELDDDGVRTLGNMLLPEFIAMLNELALELRHLEITQAPEDNRMGLLLDAMRSTKVLLILDNLESLSKTDRDRFFAFIKRLPHGCKAILTSRRRIGSSTDTIILEKLDQNAALEMMEDIARRNPLVARTTVNERLELYAEVGGNPLLLRFVVGQLGRGSCRTISDALHFLRSNPASNDPLEFIFGDLAQEFTADETKVLGALTCFTQLTRVEEIADLADVDTVLVENVLRSLANRSLVVPDQEEKQYALVPMVAEFLRIHLPETVSKARHRLERQP